MPMVRCLSAGVAAAASALGCGEGFAQPPATLLDETQDAVSSLYLLLQVCTYDVDGVQLHAACHVIRQDLH